MRTHIVSLLCVLSASLTFAAAAEEPEAHRPPTPRGDVAAPHQEAAPEARREPRDGPAPEFRERIERHIVVREDDRGPDRERRVEANREPRDLERRAMERQLDRARDQRRRLLDDGREKEADELAARIQAMKRRWAALNRPQEPEARRRDEQRPDDVRGQERPRSEMPREERIEHVRAAIGHLHAAGLHGIADRLEREAHRRTTGAGQAGMPRPGNRGPFAPGPDNADLQRQVDELRRHVEELHRRLNAER